MALNTINQTTKTLLFHQFTIDLYRSFLQCSVCGYRTHCNKAYPDHMITKHGRLANPENTNREFSTGFMECICGVVHIDGNKMGRFIITSQPHRWRNG